MPLTQEQIKELQKKYSVTEHPLQNSGSTARADTPNAGAQLIGGARAFAQKKNTPPEDQPESPGLGDIFAGAGKQAEGVLGALGGTLVGADEFANKSAAYAKEGQQQAAGAVSGIDPTNIIAHPVETAKGIGKGALSTVQDLGGMVQTFGKTEYGFLKGLLGYALGDKEMEISGNSYLKEGLTGKVDRAIPQEYTKATNPAQATGKSIESVLELVLPFLDQNKVAQAAAETGGDVSKWQRVKNALAKPAGEAEIKAQAENAVGYKLPQQIKNEANAAIPQVELPSRGTMSKAPPADLRKPLSEMETAIGEHRKNLYTMYEQESSKIAASHAGEDLSKLHTDINNGITTKLDELGIRRATKAEIKKGSELYIDEGSKLNPAELELVGNAIEELKNFPVQDAVSFNRMSQKFASYIPKASKQSRQILTSLWKDVITPSIEGQISEWGALNKAYGEGLDLANAAEKLLDERKLGKLGKDLHLTEQDTITKLEQATGREGKILKPTMAELERVNAENTSIKARTKLMQEAEKGARADRASKVTEEAQRMSAAQKRALQLKIEEITASQPKLRKYLLATLGLLGGGAVAKFGSKIVE